MYKKISVIASTLAIILGLTAPASAADKTKYKNCTALAKVYPGGVARAGGMNMTKSKGKIVPAKSKKTPLVDDELYNLNKKLDADKDGVACEK